MTGLKIPFTGLKKQYNNLRLEILDVTDEVLRSGDLMNGNYTAEFENWLAKKNHTKYAITCHSGTHALEIIAAYYSTYTNRVDQPVVLIPSLTYVATANAFMRAGWKVQLADTDKYGIIDLKKIPDGIEYRAIVGVGLYGMALTNLDWGRRKASFIIEDAAQHWLAHECHRIGNAAAISFDPMKNLSCYGNGGAVVTDDIDLLEFARSWRDNGKPTHQTLGTNSRMSELDCAHMMVKTQYIDEWQHRREDIARYWMGRLYKTGIRCLINQDNVNTHCFHKFVIDVDQRDILKRNLDIHNIETKIHYAHPLHELPVYADLPGPDILSAASSLSRRVLSLPIYPELTDLEVEYIIDQVLNSALA
jgi:dTDP-4-amino-4,6-dideoxygalactose transaminase